MDTNKDYIKMCEKAKKIQKKWMPKIGDSVSVVWKKDSDTGGLEHLILADRPCYGIGYEFYHNKDKDIAKFYHYNGSTGKDSATDTFRKQYQIKLIDMDDFKSLIWLPHQDQLQEMVTKFKEDKNLDIYWMLRALHDFQVKHTLKSGIKSMEQLWLAFVMKEKYSKTWNGKDWIK